MQADAQPRIAAGDANRLPNAWLVDHEAGLGQQAGLVMALDGFVDDVAAAEVVAGEDEMFQFANDAGRVTAPR